MRRYFIFAAKSVLAVLTLTILGVMAFSAYLAWRYAYGIGLPDHNRLAVISATGPACSAEPQRAYVSLAEIPPLLRKAVILSEDPDYYERPSLNLFAELILAVARDRPPRPSDITASVTRCLMSLTECCRGPGLDWHIGNAILQNRVVRVLSRDRIFEILLNESYLGRGSYGVAAASMSYFGKPLGQLNVSEIALVALLLKAPSLWNGRTPDIIMERRNAVIDKMLQAGVIDDIEAASARGRPLEFREIPSKPQNL